MATGEKRTDDPGVVGRLSRRGEEAVTRLVEELGRNERVTDALGRAMSAKGRLDTGAKRALNQVGLAPADDLADLRKQVERLEKRLAKLEGASGAKGTARRSETKRTSTAKRRTTRAKSEEKTPSPPTGRALGGGTGRGGSAGGGTAAA